jgi:hypothetical protein
MSNQVSCANRRSLIDSERTIRIDGDSLVLKEGEAPEQRVALRDVARIRLAFGPTRVQDGLYICSIWRKGHARPWVTLHSQSYRGFADFEDHTEAYRTFVQALNDAVARSNPAAKFEAGSSTFMYALNIGCLGLGAIALAWVLIITNGEGWSEITITKAFLVLGMIPLGIAWISANRPRTYDPRSIPTNVMPAAPEVTASS